MTRRRRRAAWVGVVLGAGGIVLLLLGLPFGPGAATPAAGSFSVHGTDPLAVASGAHTAAPTSDPPRSEPVHVDIPRIGVDAEVVPVGLNPDGTVGVPPLETGAPVGWYRYLAAPGDPGPAVLLGHVDTYRGPAVFYRIHELQPGDAIDIQRADGRGVEFTVDAVRTYPKSQFPSQVVYGPSAEPVLRLVTCGGVFDRNRRTYLSNVVVYASLASPVGGPPGSRAR